MVFALLYKREVYKMFEASAICSPLPGVKIIPKFGGNKKPQVLTKFYI